MIKKVAAVVVVVCATMGCKTREYVRKPDMPVFPQTFSPEMQVLICNPLLNSGANEVIDKLGKAWGYRYNHGIPFVKPFTGAKGNPEHKFRGE